MTDGVGRFFKEFQDGPAGQILEFAGKFNGAFGALTGVISLFEPSDTDRILEAIEELREEMNRNFDELGDLIKRQIQLLADITNRNDMASALSNSDTAFNRMQDFLANDDRLALNEAKTQSALGVHFFTNLPITSTDLPFFLPGLVKAGTIRIFVIASEPDDSREPDAVVTQDVTRMITHLSTMIEAIKNKVDVAHRVARHGHTISCPPHINIAPGEDGTLGDDIPERIEFVLDGFSHVEHHVEPDGSVRIIEYEFFAPEEKGGCDNPVPVIGDAETRAEDARNRGVNAELAFLSVPTFEQILQSWRDLLPT